MWTYKVDSDLSVGGEGWAGMGDGGNFVEGIGDLGEDFCDSPDGGLCDQEPTR